MHKVQLSSDITRVYKSEDGHDVEVDVLCCLDPELLFKLDRQPDASLVHAQTVVVSIDRQLRCTDEQMLCLAEIASLTHILDVRQGNGFSLKSRTVPIVDVTVYSKRTVVIEALNQKSILRDLLLKEHAGHLLKEFDLLSAYACGVEARAADEVVVEKCTKSPSKVRIYLGGVLRCLEIETTVGEVKLTQRSIRECFELPLNLELRQIDASRFVRPYELVRRVVGEANKEMDPGHQHLKNLRSKFGATSKTLINDTGVYTLIDLVAVNERGKYLVIGFRQLYSKSLQKRLREKGFLRTDSVK